MVRVGSKYKWWLLGIIPLAYLLIGFHFNLIIGMLSLRNMDPEYIYFMSGVNVSKGILDLAHVDNPGSPLQFLAALTFRLTYLMRPHDVPYLNDLLSHSDLYMNMLNHVILLLVSLVLLAGGYYTLKVSGSVIHGLLVQTTPFYAEILGDMAGRVIPELLISIPVIFTSVIILKIIRDKSVSQREIIILAILSAFGLSLKYNYITLWIIPLVVIPSWRKKGAFMMACIGFFIVFALPAIIRLQTSWEWVYRLISRSGLYGSGHGFVDWALIGDNLGIIFMTTRPFFYFSGLLFLILVVATAMRKVRLNEHWARVVMALMLVVVFHLFMVSRHYAYRYLIPMISLTPLILLLTGHGLISVIDRPWVKKAVLAILLLLFIPGTIHQVNKLRIKSKYITTDVENRNKTRHFIQSMGMDNIRLIAAKGYGNPFHERALMFSYAYAGKIRKKIKPVLGELYPNSYLHFTWDNTMRTWGQPWDSLNIFSRNKPVYLFIENDGQESLDRSMKFFFGEVGINGTLITEKKFANEKTKEGIYLLRPALVPEILQ